MTETTIFAAALDKQTDAERAAYLDEVCAGDEKLRRRVEALLKAHAAPDSILDAAKNGPATTDIGPITEKTGTRIGPYRLMEQIGEGGFGVVFVAEQQEPVRRKVALKLIKPGMDSSQVIARFEAERQALAMMDHPNIARVLDAGATDTGRPYFVMELVRGISITEYCDKNQLNPSERMEIFVTVCNAIQHAHQKGIIHRDIKPSNVLVTSHDGRPVAKVIDFGVAKAIHQQLTERTIYTQFAQMIGTPLYMSPEQAEMSGLDIDTRSDIYSLGVLLYELFTGSTPLEKSRLVSAAFDEVRRLIREDEPLRPSQRLSTSATLSSLAANRKTEPARLSHQMKRELDWIVMKALEKDRTRRYETASAFAADIGRYLRDEQVEACPPSVTYQLRKFIRRNRFVFVSGSLVTAALLIGVIFSTWFAVRAREQQKLAQVARLAAEQERDRAEKAQQTAMIQSQQAEVQRQNAETARASEETQRSAAEQERDKATALSDALALEKQELSRQKESQRRMLYISDMNLVQAAWAADNVSRVLELLNAHRPQPGQTDLRGFEWHFWNRQCHSDLRTVKLKNGSTSIPAVFSPDGKRLVGTRLNLNSPEDARIIVWDTETGAELQSLGSLVAPFLTATLAWHPDRQHVAITSFDLSDTIQVQMLDLASDKLLFKIVEPQGVERIQEILAGPSDLWFSSDGARLATVVGKREGELPVNSAVVKFWDAQTGAELATVPLPGERVSNVTISVDGARIAYASHTPSTESSPPIEVIIILNVETPDRKVTIPLPRPASFRFSPDGRQLLVSGVAHDSFISGKEGGAGVFDTSSGQKLVSMPDSDPWFIAKFSPDGQWLAVNTSSRPCSVKLYHTNGNRASAEFQGHTTSVTALSFSPDSKSLFTASSDDVLKTWDVAAIRSEPTRQASVSNLLNTFSVVSNDGRQIATAPRKLSVTGRLATDTTKNVVTVCDDSGKVLYQPAELEGPIRWMKFSTDGRRLAACSVNPNADVLSAAQICVWDTATGAERLALRLPNEEVSSEPGAALSPDGSRLAVFVSHGHSTARTSKIKVWEIDSKREVWESEEAKQGADLLFSPNGRLVLGGVFTGTPAARYKTGLAVWDAEDGQLLWNDDSQIGGLSFSDDSTQILGYNYGREKIQLWNATSGVELDSFLGPSFSHRVPDTTKLSLSPNGKHLAAMGRPLFGARSNDAVVWDMNGPEREQLTLKGHSQIVRRVGTLAFSPESRRIVTSAGSIANIGEIKLWDAESGQELLTLPGAARNLRFSANGSILIGEMGFNLVSEIRVERWDASPLSPQVEAEQIIEAFTSRGSSESLPLMSEILARIDADKALPEETRAVAVTLAKGLRREQELFEAAWQIAHLPSRPKEKYERALRYLEEGGTTDPENRDAWSTRGLLHYRLGQPAEALAALAHNRKLHAERNLSLPADDYVTLAMLQFQAGQHEESRSTLERVWTSVSRSEAAWMKLIGPSGGYQSLDYSLIRKLPEWPEIVAEAETLLGVPKAADNPTRWIGKAFMPRWRDRGNSPNLPYKINRIEGDRLWFGKNSITQLEVVPLDSASQYYTRLLEFAPQSHVVHNYLGIASRATGRYDKAIEHYSAAIRLKPKQSVYHHNRGLVWHEDNRDFDKALEDYDKALSLSPSNAEFHVSRGILRREQGHFDDALKSFGDAINLQPDFGGAYAHRATIWSARSDKVRMQKDLDDAILYSPDDPGTLGARAWLMATSPNKEHRNGKQAVLEAKRACEQLAGVADNYQFHAILAASYAENDDFKQAVKWQKQAIAIAPPAWRADFESRLKLYQKEQKYRDIPRTPAATEVISAPTDPVVK